MGAAGAKYMIIGEAPGASEDSGGMPFLGAAGKRLNKLLEVSGISLNDCYITNICRCRPHKNQNPKKSEIRACVPWLIEEIKTVDPSYIIVLGGVPTGLFSSYGIKNLHGTMFAFDCRQRFPLFTVKKGGVYVEEPGTGLWEDRKRLVIAQYHPAAALHQPRLWATMLDDWANLPEYVPHDFTIVGQPSAYPELIGLDTENDPNGVVGAWSVAWRDSADGELKVQDFHGPIKNQKFEDCKIVMHNAKWDIRVMRNNGMWLPKPDKILDTMIAAYCMGCGHQNVGENKGNSDPGIGGGLGLKYLTRRHLSMQQKTWNEVKDNPELIPEYNAEDSVGTLLLMEKWQDKLPQHFWDIDMPLLDVLMCMEDRGIAVDNDFLTEYGVHLDEEISKITIPFNHKSPIELRKYVYDDLGIKPWLYTKETKQPSTAKEVLETINDKTIRDILRLKGYQLERTTYLDNYIGRMSMGNRIHPEFKQTRTSTGRLSSANPNLQNVPRDGDMRKLFVAPPGKKLIRLDFSQLELRVFAAMTGETAMLDALLSGRSIHQETADATGLSYNDAKTLNFLMLYEGSAFTVAKDTNLTKQQAQDCIDNYYRKYPRVPEYHEEIKAKAFVERKVVDFFGRERRIDALFAEDWRIRQEGMREAINMPIQGTGAEIVKLVMIDLHQKHAAPMLLQVHDELVFEVAAADAEEYSDWLRRYVPDLVTINGINFPVEVGVGDNWQEAKKNGR